MQQTEIFDFPENKIGQANSFLKIIKETRDNDGFHCYNLIENKVSYAGTIILIVEINSYAPNLQQAFAALRLVETHNLVIESLLQKVYWGKDHTDPMYHHQYNLTTNYRCLTCGKYFSDYNGKDLAQRLNQEECQKNGKKKY